MRDGIRLYSVIYAPKDTTKTYPVLVNFTPYGIGPYDEVNYKHQLGPSMHFTYSRDYIFVYQDVRGCYMSEGDFENVSPMYSFYDSTQVDPSTDAYDTFEYLKDYKKSNGKIGVWGMSYGGYYANASLISLHSALKAVNVQAPVVDWFRGDDFFHNGAFFPSHAFNFFSGFGRGREKGPTTQGWKGVGIKEEELLEFFDTIPSLTMLNKTFLKNKVSFWNKLESNRSYNAFWKERNQLNYLRNKNSAVLVTGGWYDAEDLYGTLETFNSFVKNQNSPIHLIMGPWKHGEWWTGKGGSLGSHDFQSHTSDFYRDSIEFPFFQYYLKDSGVAPDFERLYFDVGINEWVEFYHQSQPSFKDTIAFTNMNSTTKEGVRINKKYVEYVSDPLNPILYSDKKQIGIDPEYMISDQSKYNHRQDVVEIIHERKPYQYTLTGQIELHLSISTTGTDGDWIVKLIDIDPHGKKELIRFEVMRGKYRKGLDKEVPFLPKKSDIVKFTLNEVYYTIKKGHRLGVQVQNTWYPLISINTNRFGNQWEMSSADFLKVKNRIYYDKSYLIYSYIQ